MIILVRRGILCIIIIMKMIGISQSEVCVKAPSNSIYCWPDSKGFQDPSLSKCTWRFHAIRGIATHFIATWIFRDFTTLASPVMLDFELESKMHDSLHDSLHKPCGPQLCCCLQHDWPIFSWSELVASSWIEQSGPEAGHIIGCVAKCPLFGSSFVLKHAYLDFSGVRCLEQRGSPFLAGYFEC